MSKHDELVQHWREIGPIEWAESQYGWITEGGAPVVLEPWQRAVLAAWWAHRDVVTTIALSNVKKSGKTLLNSLLTAWRWLTLSGLHLIGSNDEEQSIGRQFGEISGLVKRNAYLRANCKVSRMTIEFIPTGSVLQALATDSKGNAGSNHATISYTECWGIMSELAERAWSELTTPPGLFSGLPALRVCDSYAGYPDSTTWHTLVDAGLAGDLISDEWPIYLAGGILLFHMEGEEAQRRCFRGTPEQAAVYYADQKAQLRPMAYQRLHQNQRTAGAEAFLSEDQWRAIETESGPMPPNKSAPLYAGLDLAVKHDTAALIGATPNGNKRARIALHRVWKAPKKKGGEIQLAKVMEFILELHASRWLGAVFYDPSQAQLMAQQLRAKGVRMVEVPQSLPELGPRGLSLYEAVRDGRLTTYADDELKAAALAAQAREVPQGLHITKGANKARKIDLMAALSFALPAAMGGEATDWESVEGLGHVAGYTSLWADPGRETEGPYFNWR